MKNAMIFGLGNIGAVLIKHLQKENIYIKYIVRSGGIFDPDLNKITVQGEWIKYIHTVDMAFICIPTQGKGERAFEYEMAFLKQGKPVITCEKASIAYNWETLRKYKEIFKYSASVGGGTQMLKEISRYKPEDIQDIKAVVNGTLNYISDSLKSGKTKEQLVKEVVEKGYAEPGASTFEEIIKGELNDVILKTVIIANHSGMFDRVIEEKDIQVAGFNETKRCIVKISKDKIEAGFIEDNMSEWLPDGVNNVLYINGEKKAYGPGAGAEATVVSMISGYQELR